MRAAARRGLPVWSEVELGYVLLTILQRDHGDQREDHDHGAPRDMFATGGRAARVLGNIGRACHHAGGGTWPQTRSWWLRCPSFQLEDVHSFRPAAGVLLNLTQDHLDRHGTMQRYLACKRSCFNASAPGMWPFSNRADPELANWGAPCSAGGRPEGLFFSTEGPRGADLLAGDGRLFLLGRFVPAWTRSPFAVCTTWRTAWRRARQLWLGGSIWRRFREALLTFPGGLIAAAGRDRGRDRVCQ